MRVITDNIFLTMWLAYSVYWWLLASKVKDTERQESLGSRLVRLSAILLAFLLLWLPHFQILGMGHRFLPSGIQYFWIGAAVTAIGLLFSIWARRHLGANWSQAVTLKSDHELITSGPYAFTRHPIYTGLLLGFLGSAIARAEWRGLLAVILVLTVLWRKLKLEESWLQAQFGDSYIEYSRRVSALVPYIL